MNVFQLFQTRKKLPLLKLLFFFIGKWIMLTSCLKFLQTLESQYIMGTPSKFYVMDQYGQS